MMQTQKLVYAKITGKIDDASDGTEDGILEFANMKGGNSKLSQQDYVRFIPLLNGTTFSTQYKLSTADGTNGQVMTTDGNGTLIFNYTPSRYYILQQV